MTSEHNGRTVSTCCICDAVVPLMHETYTEDGEFNSLIEDCEWIDVSETDIVNMRWICPHCKARNEM